MALALVKAGADVNCKDNGGYASGMLAIVMRAFGSEAGLCDRCRMAVRKRIFDYAGIQRCTWHRRSGTQRQRLRW
jgi:hypothetical protein